MIIVLKNGATKEQMSKLIGRVEENGMVKATPIIGEHSTIIGLIGDTYSIDESVLLSDEIVEKVMRVQEPYKKANRKFHPEDTVIDVGGVKIGGKKLVIIGGPCSVENAENIDDVSREIIGYGADMIRGGTYKPRTSPYAFQGLGYEGLKLLNNIRNKYNVPVVSEITNPNQIDEFLENVDMIQVGARSMQNFELLKALGKIDKPILLKRGLANTIEELLMSAEYVMAGGNRNVILCERGIRTFEPATRNTLDINAIPLLKQLTHLPILIDPSHACGIASLVPQLCLAGIAAGADGVLVEVHNNPGKALTDGKQSITPSVFKDMIAKIKRLAPAVDREV